MSTNLEYEQRIAELEKEVKELKERLTVNMKREKYGLNWIDVPEAFDKESENKIPVLEEVKEKSINNDDGKPTHILIEGDNYHALQCLNYTHKGKVDVIYIDPPYNTGSDGFVYKDARFLDKYPDGTIIPKEHPLRHSTWLSFMSKRLAIAKQILSDNGVIFISIDDNEQANLRLLCDSIFGEENFITVFHWEKTQHFGRQKINSYSNCEYILCYAKRLFSDSLKELLVERIKNNLTDAPLYNASNNEKNLVFPIGSVKFNMNDGTYNEAKSDQYFLLKPVTVKNGLNITPLEMKFKSRWAQKTINDELSKGTSFWVKSENFAIRTIYSSDKTSKDSPKSLIFTNSNNPLVATNRFSEKVGTNENATNELDLILEQSIFNYPKPVSLLEYLISLYYDCVLEKHPEKITILDFFAGSGTTLHATMKLNEEDGGHRQCILVQMNENNICEEVTYERNKRVIQGYKNSKGEQLPGLGNSLKYYKTAFIGKNNAKNATDDDRTELARRAGCLLSLGENMLDEVESNEYFQIFTDKKNATAIYFTDDYEMLDDFIEKMEEISSAYKKIIIYVFSWSTGSEIVNEFAHIRNAEIKPIPTPILEIYKSIYN